MTLACRSLKEIHLSKKGGAIGDSKKVVYTLSLSQNSTVGRIMKSV